MTQRAILVVGEALVDEVHRRDGRVETHPGGSPANVALGLARLGRPATLVTRLGADAYGELISDHLAASGVAVHPGSWPPGARTSVAVATLDASAHASYDFRLTWDLDRSVTLDPALLDGVDAVHTGSLATALEPGAGAVRALLARASGRVPISYDPNLRPGLLGDPDRVRPDVEGLVRHADLVKASEEDLSWLYPGRPYEDVAGAWLQTGGGRPGLVIVTRSGEGSYARTEKLELRRPVAPAEVVDTVGAGDAFTAGLLDVLRRADRLDAAALAALDEAELARCVEFAARVAALTCARPGADPPHRDELPS